MVIISWSACPGPNRIPFSKTNFLAGDQEIPGNFNHFQRSSAREAKYKDCLGGGRRLRRTALSLHFPANREFNSKILSFLPTFHMA